MSFHNDYVNWERMTRQEHCPICNQAPKTKGTVRVVKLTSAWLNVEPAVCLKGTCCVISKRHALELYELTDAELLSFMKDVARCAQALKKVTNAVKINYEIHGNTVPHLHIHLFPRYIDDPFPGQPIDFRQRNPDMYAEGEFVQFVEDLRKELSKRRIK